jgi:replicative DNA helicase
LTEAEIGVIGCALIDNDSMYKVYNKLKSEMFSTEFCQDAFAEMLAMYDRGENINIISLSQALENHKWDPEMIAAELKECVTAAPVSSVMTSYAEAVVKDWRARETKKLFQEVSLRPCDIDNSIAEVLTKLEEIQGSKTVHSKTMKQIVVENKGNYFNEHVGEGLIKTGFYHTDDCLGGLEGGDITAIGARPGVGKSAIVTQMIGQMAEKGYNIGYYNLEMNESQVYERFVSRISEIGLTRVRRAKTFLGGEQEAFEKANDKLSGYNITISTGAKSVSEIRAECRHQRYDVIVIDYLQLIKADRRFTNRASEVGDISKAIKALATELHVPIILLSQLNRASEARETKEPTMAELRESGDIEQDASNIILLWNLDEDGVYKGWKVEKQRQGTHLKEVLKFDGDHMKFTERTETIEQIQARLRHGDGFREASGGTPFD